MGTRRKGGVARYLVVGLASAVVLVGCGNSPSKDLVRFVPLTPSTSSSVVNGSTTALASTAAGEAPTTAPAPAAPTPGTAWQAVTGSLTGMASECGNLTLVSARPDRDVLITGVAQHGL